MWIKLLMLVHSCVSFTLKCPEPAQWARRASGHCADPSKYFCLRNDLIKGYSENCTRSDFQQPGRKAVLRGGIDADVCSVERYQPFPIKFFTNASTNCIFLKSLCNEEGQVVYDPGNRNTDTTCRCDYRRGFDFLVKPNNRCFCKPSHEDCSCYLKTCSNGNDILSPDYDCITVTDLTRVMQCLPVTDETKIISRSQPEKTGNITLENNISFSEPWKKHPTIVIGVLLFGTLLVFIALLTNCFGALIIKDPGPSMHVIEGDSLNLRYNLPTKISRINIFKDKKLIANPENVKKCVHIKDNVSMEDQGDYCASWYLVTSNITKVTVDSFFKKAPQQEVDVIEGGTLTLQYNLRKKVDKLNLYKGDMCKGELFSDHTEYEYEFKRERIPIGIKGCYYAKVNNIESNTTKVTVKSLFEKAPIEEVDVIEGEELLLQYHLRKQVANLMLYKDNKCIKERLNTAGYDFRKEKISMEDKGSYFAEADSIKSVITKVKVNSLICNDPGPDIKLIEGESLKLQYDLRIKRHTLQFFKDGQYLAKSENAKKVYRIEKVTKDHQGNYFASVNSIQSNSTKVTVASMFTSSFDPIYCIEGEKLQVNCSVYSASIEVKWFKKNSNGKKHDKIASNKCIYIDHNGKDHVMTIQNAKITDSGQYIIIAGKVRKQLTVTVEAFFIQPLKDTTIMEGLEVSFECEAEKTCPVAWFKDNILVKDSSKYKIEILHNSHKLTIRTTTVEDKGKYRIQIKDKTDVSCCADLEVKEMPQAVKQMSDHDRNMFLKAAKSGTAVRYYIRIMIVGESGVGKTCLLRRLMKEQIDDVKTTEGINIEIKQCKINRQTQKWIFPSDKEFSETAYQNEEFADCGFWDFAGQKEFYATHQTFLSTNAIYLLVVDISKDFAGKSHKDMIEDEFDKVGEYIEFWLDSIHCYALPDQDGVLNSAIPDKYDALNSALHYKDVALNPPVIIIGTGIDKIKKEEERCKQEQRFKSALTGHDKRMHIRTSYFLSNTDPHEYQTEFENLRRKIFELAGNIPNWGDYLPTRWIVLEKEFDRQLAQEKKLIISYKYAKHLAKMSSFPICEIESELDSFLKYEHEIGNLIFFDDIKSCIVLEPKWLVDIFKCFVSPFQFQEHLVEMIEWKQLESTGILPDSLIKKLFKKVHGFDSVKHTQFALQVMEKFDIIVKPTTLKGTEEYYMPCMINATDSEILTKTLNDQSKNCSRTSWFCLEFNFLPPSFFNHVLVTFVKRYVVCTDEYQRLQLYRGMGIFNLENNGCQKLVACLSENSIAVQIWKYKSEEQQICNINYSIIREYLISTVHSLQRRYKINIHYECFLKCAGGKYYKTEGKVSCDETGDNYFCPEHCSTHSLKEIRKIWFQDEKEESTCLKNNIPVKCHYCERLPMYRCYECSNVLCDDCYLKHDELSYSKKHTFQSTNDKMQLNNKFKVSSWIVDMKALPGGLLIIGLYHSEKLLTYSVSDKRQNEIGIGGRPRIITILDRNTVVALISRTYGVKLDAIEIVDIRQRQVIQHVNMAIHLSSYTSSPMFYTDDQLYIRRRTGITVMDMSGTIDREIDLGFTPRDVCYDTKAARIYCIDDSEKKLICIDRDGNTIFTFTDTALTNAKRLTIDNAGFLLILCHGDYSIHHFKVHRISPDGKSGENVITGKQNKTFTGDFSSICLQEESDELVIGIDDIVYTYKKK